jgi:hypothetical protein
MAKAKVELPTKKGAIQEYSLVNVKLKDLKYDPENPNEMTAEEEQGLRHSFSTFGNVQFIVIDQNDLIVHGNHRAKVLQDMGIQDTKVIKRIFKDNNERRMFSQTMNKLHGSYDKIRDASQLAKLFESNRLPELASLLGQKETDLVEFINLFGNKNVNIDDLDLQNKILTTIDDESLQLKFQMRNQEEYEEVITKLRYIDEVDKETALLKMAQAYKIE